MTFPETRERAAERWREFTADNTPRMLVGTGTCGQAAGALSVMTEARSWFENRGIPVRVYEVGCLGLCYAEPLVELSRPGSPAVLYGHLEGEVIRNVLGRYFEKGELCEEYALAVMNGPAAGVIPAFNDHPVMSGQVRVALRNCGLICPDSIEHYIATGGYTGLVRALEMSPDAVVQEVSRSGLRGRGGAGFPTGVKWDLCRKQEREEKFMICNADEGDPGAFMDRSLLESDPHSVIEGLAIAAYAIGARNGYIYVRAEYPLAIERLRIAISQAEECSLIGDNILGSGVSFHLAIKKGAGAFVCGEETALLASIEGRRGMPRSRPPFPAQRGLHGRPTTINNVETLANVPVILRDGSAAYLRHGTEDSRGTKTFALAGKVKRTGLIEVPFGITLREIVHGIGGGASDSGKIKAVQTGGPSGGCIPARLFDLPVDYRKLAEAGAIIGSGGMIVMDESTCMVDIARYFIDFTQKESCGKCVPCRLGTRQMLEILEDITSGRARDNDLADLQEIANSVKVASLCGLGQTAPNPVLTTLRYFRDEYEAHARERVCPVGACAAMLVYTIDAEKCVGCRACMRVCPVQAVSGEAKQVHEIDLAVCVSCGACYEVCKFDAVKKG